MKTTITIITTILALTFSHNAFAELAQAPISEAEKTQLITTFAKLMGKEVDPNNPKTLQAAEAFIAIDAGKSYAFTKTFGVTLEYCKHDTALESALEEYKKSAVDFIRLGESYYYNGIDLQIGEKYITQTGKELTDGLNKQLESMRADLKSSSKTKLAKKCTEATEALKMLAKMYGG